MSEQTISLHDSGVRRLKAKAPGWVKWFMDYTFHVRRHDGAPDKTVMAWRGFQTAVQLALLGLGTAILNHVSPPYTDNSLPRIEKRLSDLENKVDDNSRELRYVKDYVKGLDSLEPKVDSKNMHKETK